MFPRSTRLPRAAFPAALTRGKRISSKHFTAILPENVSGYAVVVSKKVARLSVTRHKIKRRVLAALRALALPPALIVFPKASAMTLTYRETKEELATFFPKRHL